MAVTANNVQLDEYQNFLSYKNLHPESLLILFKEYAPHVFLQKEAQLVFKELKNYLTDKEERELFYAWEDFHINPGEFFSIIHSLLDKYKE